MKIIGFLDEHNLGLSSLPKLEQQFDSENLIDEIEFEKVLSYLEKGYNILPLLHYLYDKQGDAIGPCIIKSDGEWIWPSYFEYYLRKHRDYKIPTDFINYLRKIDYSMPIISNSQRVSIEKYLFKLFKIKISW